MMKFQRFADLKASGTRRQLGSTAQSHSRPQFPARPNVVAECRAWSDAEIDQWLASRPQAGSGSGPHLRGNAKMRVELARAKREASTSL